LLVSDIDEQNNALTLSIIKDSYPTDFIELFKPLNEDFVGLHDLPVVLKQPGEPVFIFDLRERKGKAE
ncbi:MAG: hypothetical protein ACW964_05815, partial [Candidatus Hodarchaeales archaeon]